MIRLPSRWAPAMAVVLLAAVTAVVLAACGGSSASSTTHTSTTKLTLGKTPTLGKVAHPDGGYVVPPLQDPANVYAADTAWNLEPVAKGFRHLVYVPNSGSNTVDEIDPTTYKIVRHFAVGDLPQHVVPSYDLKTLWVTNDLGNTLTPIDPVTGAPGRPVPVEDPYNMYFEPDGRYALIMAERLRRIDFRDAHTMRLHHQLHVDDCPGVNHADFTADGRFMMATCEFGAGLIVIDVPREREIRHIALPPSGSPQDVKLSPDGRIFYVADLSYSGVWMFDAHTFKRIGYIRTGAGAHGLYPSRDAKDLYVSNRGAGTVSVISFKTNRVIHTWTIPGGSPDMGGVSASGHILWLSGRYGAEVYAINTSTGKLIRRIPVGLQPHGLCVYPQPGRYSLGHTGIMR